MIESIQTLDDSDVELSDVIIGQGNFASVWKGVLRTEGIEVAVKLYHPDIKAVDIQKEIDAMTQLKHDFIIPLRGKVVFLHILDILECGPVPRKF